MDSKGLNRLAENMLNKFGQECNIFRSELGSFDAVLNEYIKVETTETALFAFLTARTNGFNTNTQFTLKSDERLIILKTDTVIDKDSTFELNGVLYSLSESEEIIFKEDTIVYKIVVKRKDA